MHVSKPPKIQNQTKNTKREPELETPRTDLQTGHVIEAALSRPPSHVVLFVFWHKTNIIQICQTLNSPWILIEFSIYSHWILNKFSLNSYQILNKLDTMYMVRRCWELCRNALRIYWEFNEILLRIQCEFNGNSLAGTKCELVSFWIDVELRSSWSLAKVDVWMC